MFVDLKGFDTQLAPMAAIEEILNDCHGEFISPKMAVIYITAIVHEWRQRVITKDTLPFVFRVA